MPLSSGQLLNNRYRIGRMLGQGGFGAVYRAWDDTFDAPCAIKENVVESEAAQRQFLREARLLHSLRHPNLPQVTDHFVLPGLGQYLVMDFIEGQDLGARLEQNRGPLVEAQTLDWIGQVCRALDYLHSQRPPVIHRDIKPANIRITPAGQAVLVDFGIAKRYDAGQQTTSGARAVTPGYSPPEQYGEAPTDARSDVYSLGATLYHLLSNQRPPDSISVMTRTAPPPEPLPALNPTVSPWVGEAVARAMQLDPERRFASVAEFAAALGLPAGGPAAPRPAQPPVAPTAVVQVWPPGRPLQAPYQTAAGAPPFQPVQPTAARPAPARRRSSCLWLAAGLALAGVLGLAALWFVGMALQSLIIVGDGVSDPTRPATGNRPTVVGIAAVTATPAPGGWPTAVMLTAASATPAPNGLSERFTDQTGVIMALVPAGEFQMGGSAEQAQQECLDARSDCQVAWFKNEEPVHTVWLDAYYIDLTEVSNAQYIHCVDSGACTAPAKNSSETRQDYYGVPKFADHPVVWVDWEQAQRFCQWRGGRLPTEAEWEKAARGGLEAQLYPWGDTPPDCTQANFNNCVGDTTLIGSYAPTGYGLLDMGGNVWEWTADWWDVGYYSVSPPVNPPGPATGTHRVARAGSFNNPAHNLRNAFRFAYPATAKASYLGFRCVHTP